MCIRHSIGTYSNDYFGHFHDYSIDLGVLQLLMLLVVSVVLGRTVTKHSVVQLAIVVAIAMHGNGFLN